MICLARYRLEVDMKAFRAAMFLLVVGLPNLAFSAPILFNGGVLDGALRIYDQASLSGPLQLVLRREFVLGTDFFPMVPLSNQLGGVPYSDCSTPAPFFGADCVTGVQAIWEGFPAVNAARGTAFGEPGSQGPLDLGCDPFQNGSSVPGVAMVERGQCTFSSKWTNADLGGFGGLLVVNNAPGPAGPVAIVPMPDPSIPSFLISQDAAAEIRRGTFVLDDLNCCRFNTYIEMRVAWLPSSQVPEPATLALLGIGLAGLGFSRRKRAN